MTKSLSSVIRVGFNEACNLQDSDHRFSEAQGWELALTSTSLLDLPKLLQRREVPASRQDELLAATIRAYRRGPAALWGPVLLSMLAPALIRMATPLHAQPPAIDDEDIDQQVIAETLRAAALMPLPESCRFVQRRLIAFTRKRLTRWLARESRHRASQAPFDALEEN